jgi:serine/threonine protein kinase
VPPACERCGSTLASAGDDCDSCVEEGSRHGEPWLGRLLDQRYRVIRRLGEGASSRVHLVRDTTTGEEVAMKTLRPERSNDPEAYSRFMREARVLNRVRHPGIVEVRDVGELRDGFIYLVMELVEGESLHSALRRGPLGVRDALVIAGRMADALVAVHAEGVAHRDLKPSNVLLGPPDATPRVVKLVDFGIASLAYTISITGPNQRLGTPGYMAPEYLRTGRATPATDQYSLGVMLYEMLALRMPYEASSPGRLLLKQTSEPPTSLREHLPDVAPELEALVMRAIAPNPTDRFAGCEAFAEAILATARQAAPGVP